MITIIIYIDLFKKGNDMKQQLVNQAILAGNQTCKVLYNKTKDMVVLEIGGTSIRFEASQFFVMNEMMRKAVAKLIMQTVFQKTT